MIIEEQAKLLFLGVDIVNVNFNAVKPFGVDDEFSVTVTPKLHLSEEDTFRFKVLMEVELDGYCSLYLMAIGNFEIDGTTAEEGLKDNFMNVNAPAIMFPYVRAFVSSFTSQVGSSSKTIVIPTQFFHGKLDVYSSEEE